MKIALIGINSKYIHKNLAIQSLHAYVKDLDHEFILREFAVNEPLDKIFHKLNRDRFDVLAFSTYLWNRDYVLKLAELIKMLHPEVKIILGGPEISRVYEAYPFIDHLVLGEGELSFRDLLLSGFDSPRVLEWKEGPLDLDSLPFVYADCLEGLTNKIIYYEGSRGCPFRCSYCLSGSDNALRLKSVGRILEEVGILVDSGVRQVKFIDRTFNANPAWAREIILGLREMAPSGCNFHFEVSVDKMDPGIMELLHDSPDGLFQLEIGIQTCNEETLKAIARRNDFGRIEAGTAYLMERGNLHLHTDLIAGLPFEDLDSFRDSFNRVYPLKAQMLQVGFLKVIPNTRMYGEAEGYGIRYRNYPPYEVVETAWLSADDLLQVKYVEEAVDGYYNKKQYRQTFSWLMDRMEDHFSFFLKLGRALFDLDNPLSLWDKFQFLHDFVLEEGAARGAEGEFLGMLRLDWYLNSRDRRAPLFLRGERELKGDPRFRGRDAAFYKLVELPFSLTLEGIDCKITERGDVLYLFDYREARTVYRYPGISGYDKLQLERGDYDER